MHSNKIKTTEENFKKHRLNRRRRYLWREWDVLWGIFWEIFFERLLKCVECEILLESMSTERPRTKHFFARVCNIWTSDTSFIVIQKTQWKDGFFNFLRHLQLESSWFSIQIKDRKVFTASYNVIFSASSHACFCGAIHFEDNSVETDRRSWF